MLVPRILAPHTGRQLVGGSAPKPRLYPSSSDILYPSNICISFANIFLCVFSLVATGCLLFQCWLNGCNSIYSIKSIITHGSVPFIPGFTELMICWGLCPSFKPFRFFFPLQICKYYNSWLCLLVFLAFLASLSWWFVGGSAPASIKSFRFFFSLQICKYYNLCSACLVLL